MKHLQLFEEFTEEERMRIIDDLRAGSKELRDAVRQYRISRGFIPPPPKIEEPVVPVDYKEVEDKQEDLNMARMERKLITDAVIKNYKLSNEEIAKKLGIDIRTLQRKMIEYDLTDVKKQLKKRGGVAWDHPYNQILPK